jgi:very-short-patch-repair endonuclease
LLLSLFDAKFPLPAQQVSVLDINGNEIFRLDFGWEEPRIALEYDGYVAHAGRAGHDAARDEELRRRGWTVIHANADDLKDPSQLHAEIRRAFWRRRFAA